MAPRQRRQGQRKRRPAPKAEAPQKPAPETQPTNWSKSKKWAVGIIATALAGALATILVNVFHDIGHAASHLLPNTSGSPTPVFVAVRREAGFSGGCGTWIVTKPVNELTPPSAGGASDQWVEQSGAIDASHYGFGTGQQSDGASNIDVTIQGRTATPVILTGIQFVPVRRSTQKIHGGAITVACGGPMEASGFEVDLSDNPIKIVSSFSYMVPKLPAGQPQWLLTPLRFPYKVTNTDGEVFKIIAYTRSYCAWYAILYWSVDGGNGQSIINDSGKPFQTAPANLASVNYGNKNHQWYTCKPNSSDCYLQL
jgi:hypothetical protein